VVQHEAVVQPVEAPTEADDGAFEAACAAFLNEMGEGEATPADDAGEDVVVDEQQTASGWDDDGFDAACRAYFDDLGEDATTAEDAGEDDVQNVQQTAADESEESEEE